ncbi:MAG: hypothetical protein VX500_09500, partial [Planctomycetota bacterium]|nr:hypothetical protein [Planctomycetota bacterium]
MGAELLEGDKGRISAAIDKVAARLGFLGQEAKAAQRFIESLKAMNEQRQVRSRLKPGATVTLRGVGAELDNTALESRRVGTMSEDEYIESIGGGRRVETSERPNLGRGDTYGMGMDSVTVSTRTTPDGRKYEIREDDDGGMFAFMATPDNPAMEPEEVVGYAVLAGEMTDLAVVEDFRGLGIGQALVEEFRSRNPMAPSGGMTEAGERAVRRAFPAIQERAGKLDLASRRGEFSSVLERTLGNLDRSKITTPEKLRSALGQAGVEREEIYWSGIDEWMKTQDPKGPIDIDEALATIQPTEVFTTIQSAKAMAESRLALKTEESAQTTVMRREPKWSDYLPGGSGSQTNLVIQYRGREGKTPQVTDQGVVLDEKKQGASHRFFDGDDNMLVHIRATDQTWEDEGDTFHLAEVQSDWAKRIRSEQDLRGGKMPVAPFVFSKRKGKVSPAWQKLALKRALAFAVDEGYKYISIPNSALVNSVDGISVRGKGYEALVGTMTDLLKDYGYNPEEVSPQFDGEVPAEDLGFTGEGQTEEQRREQFQEENLDGYMRDQVNSLLYEIEYFDLDESTFSPEEIARAHTTPNFRSVEAALKSALQGYYSTWEALTQWNSDTWSPDDLPDGFPQINHDVVEGSSGQLGLDGNEITVFQIRSKQGEVLGEAPSFREAHELLANIQIDAILQFGKENEMEIEVADPDSVSWLDMWGDSLAVFDGDRDKLEDDFREWLDDSTDFRDYVAEILDEVFYDYDAQQMGESAPLDEDAAANVFELGDASEEGTIAYNVKQQLDTVGMPLFTRRAPRREVVDTPQFRRFFGDSKIVDPQGNPLPVYRGTYGDVDDAQFPTEIAGALSFAITPEGAAEYALMGEKPNRSGRIGKYYIRSENPLVLGPIPLQDLLDASAKHESDPFVSLGEIEKFAGSDAAMAVAIKEVETGDESTLSYLIESAIELGVIADTGVEVIPENVNLFDLDTDWYQDFIRSLESLDKERFDRLDVRIYMPADTREVVDGIAERGFDSLVYFDDITGDVEIRPVSPNQVKSAIANTGEFDLASP